jgi:hypothetical protein
MNDRAMNKKTFLIYNSSLGVLDALNDEEAGKLFKAIRAYHNGTLGELDQITALAFVPFRAQFEYDEEKYIEAIKRNK